MRTQTLWTAMSVSLLACACTSSVQAGLTLYPTDDTWISMRAPDDTYCTDPYMTVRNRYGHWSHPQNWEHDALVRFDLTTIPPGTAISSAKLYLFYFKYWDDNPRDRVLTCYKIDHPWKECSTTWNTHTAYGTQPGHVPELSATAVVPFHPLGPGEVLDPPLLMSFDVTADVQQFVNQPATNFGWEIMDEKPYNNYNIPITYFYSKECGLQYIPYLYVVPEPTGLALSALAVCLLRAMRQPTAR